MYQKKLKMINYTFNKTNNQVVKVNKVTYKFVNVMFFFFLQISFCKNVCSLYELLGKLPKYNVKFVLHF